MVHCSYPSIPCCVEQPISDTCEGEDDYDGGVRRMTRDDDESEELGQGTYEGNAAPTSQTVQAVAEEGGEGVAAERREKDKGRHKVGEMVIWSDLYRDERSATGTWSKR